MALCREPNTFFAGCYDSRPLGYTMTGWSLGGRWLTARAAWVKSVRMARLHKCVAVLMVAASALACTNQKPEPLVASSVDQAGYAERYPEALSATWEQVNDYETRVGEYLGEMQNYPEELDNPDWPTVKQIVEEANRAGRTSAYVERLEEVRHAAIFFEEEKDEISRKVGGNVQYVAKEKGCDVELYGTAAAALDKAVLKQLEERLRERNPAHRVIEDNQDTLGKANVDKLKVQADNIAYTSYMANVGVKESKRKLEGMVEEAESIKATLDRVIAESNQVAADETRSEQERERAKQHAQAAEQAKARIDSDVQQAQNQLKELDERIQKLQKAYEDGYAALIQKLDEKAASSSAAPSP